MIFKKIGNSFFTFTLIKLLIANRRIRWIHTPTFLAALAVVGLVWSLFTARPVLAEGAPINVMSFNVRVDDGTRTTRADAWISTIGVSRRDLAVSVINTFNPDILGVQEALPNQVNDLQNGLPGSGFYGVGREDGVNEGEFMGIFYRNSRFTRTNQGTFWLTDTPEVPSTFPGAANRRIASWVVLADNQAGNQEYFVLNTHWDHVSGEARDFSAALIREQIKLLAGDRPLIVMGDLNALESHPDVMDLVGANDPDGFQLTDSYRVIDPVNTLDEATFNNLNGNTSGSRIDFILHEGFASTEDAEIVRTDFSGSYPSDHYPVTAILHPNPIPEPSSLLLLGLGGAMLLKRRRR